MKAIRFYLDGDATEFDTLKELRHHLWLLNDKDKEYLEGLDVIKANRKTGEGFRIATVHFKGDKVIFKKLK